MLFNNRKPDEAIMQGAALNRNPHASMAASPPTIQPRQTLGGAPARCVIDAALVITGNLESERDIQLDGELNGDIHCSQLIISKDAALNGNVVADEVVVRGRVKGTIRAGQVMLQDTARVESEIFHESLLIEEGAWFDGESHRTDQPSHAATTSEAQLADLKAMAADMKSTEKPSNPASENESAAA